MSSQQPIVYNNGYNQADFIDSLAFIPSAYVPQETSALGADFINGPTTDFVWTHLASGPSVDAAAKAAFNSFTSQYNSNNTLPQTTQAFFEAWRLSPQAAGLIQSLSGGAVPGLYNYYGIPLALASYNYALFGYAKILGIPAVIDQPTLTYPGDITSDWNILTDPVVPPANPPTVLPTITSTATLNSQFVAAFTNFLQTFNYPAGGAPVTFSYLAAQWYKFTAATVTLQIAQPPLLTAANQSITGDLPSYEDIYYAYNPGATRADFQKALVSFYNDQITQKGFFLPSQSLTAWITQNATQYNAAVSGTISYSLVSTDKSAIINRIINLLIAMIAVLQKVGIAQANQLTFLTSFQNVYVQLQSQVPVFSQGNKYSSALGGGTTPLGRAGTTAGNERNQLNTVYNASVSQNLSAFRGVQQDAAKQVQSNVNQTNDSVTQQTDMSTALIQQLNGIVGSIFR